MATKKTVPAAAKEPSTDEGYKENAYQRRRNLSREGSSRPGAVLLEPSPLDPQDEVTADHWIIDGSSAIWKDWTIEVTGLVEHPFCLSMNQLVNDFHARELSTRLVFGRSPPETSGVSISVWRGVLLRDVLKRGGMMFPKCAALNVCTEGTKGLPGGSESAEYWWTTIRKDWAMDPSEDIILAYMENGELLSPDHDGFPVSMIIPGFVGGRVVKSVKRIAVTTLESDNNYHNEVDSGVNVYAVPVRSPPGFGGQQRLPPVRGRIKRQIFASFCRTANKLVDKVTIHCCGVDD